MSSIKEQIRADINKQPTEGLEEEIERYISESLAIKFPTLNVEAIKSDIRHTARHFAEWGEKNTINKTVEWMKKNLTYMHPRKGIETCMVNIGAFLDAMSGEQNT